MFRVVVTGCVIAITIGVIVVIGVVIVVVVADDVDLLVCLMLGVFVYRPDDV